MGSEDDWLRDPLCTQTPPVRYKGHSQYPVGRRTRSVAHDSCRTVVGPYGAYSNMSYASSCRDWAWRAGGCPLGRTGLTFDEDKQIVTTFHGTRYHSLNA